MMRPGERRERERGRDDGGPPPPPRLASTLPLGEDDGVSKTSSLPRNARMILPETTPTSLVSGGDTGTCWSHCSLSCVVCVYLFRGCYRSHANAERAYGSGSSSRR